jgi:hypothetical protein
MRRLPPVLAILLLTTIAATAHAQFDAAPAAPAGGALLDKAATQQWQVGVKIQAVGGPCGGLFGTIPVPTNWPEQQVKVIHEDISPTVRRVTYREEGGIRQMLFEIPQLPAGEIAKALITFEVTKSAQVAPADTSVFVIPSKLPRDFYKYLGPSPFIESTNGKIKSVARELTAGKEGAWVQVEALYDGCRDRVKIDHDKLKGALAALRDGKAEKEDVASLFVALCRAHKVPARLVWVPDYVYAEFYLNDDKGEGHWFPCQIDGDKEFGCLSDQRPILQKGDNMRVPEKKEPQRFVAEFLTGKGGNGGRPVVEFVRRLETGMP